MEPGALILLLIVFAIVGAFVGPIRGRSSIEGALWGGFLGPFGILYLLIGGDFRPKCAECGGAVVPNSRRCQHCGEERIRKKRVG